MGNDHSESPVLPTDGPTQPISGEQSDNPQIRDATPSVLAVVVAHRPGEWFEETLDSIATQDYPRLSTMVVDAAGDGEMPERVRRILPKATILDASDTEGFGAAANAVLDTEASSAFVLICHDDVALAPDAVRVMVTESLRSNAGVVGPKLVDWDRHDRLQHVGLDVDRFGVAVEVVEPDELDQEQYDYVADFSAVPTACMLVRSDLFNQIGGFDAEITFRGDDVDLCWRAQLAGSRVVVAPDATVRHIEALVQRTGVDDVRRSRARHQLRTVLSVSSLPSLLVTLPLHFLLTVGEGVLALAGGSIGHLRDVLGAYVWNGRRSREILRRRRSIRHDRRLRFRELRQTQHRGSVRINAFVRGQIGRNRGGLSAAGRGFATSMRTGTARAAWIITTLVVMFILFGSRSLLTDGVPAIGGFSAFPDHAGDMLSQWWSGWHSRDLGSPGSVPSGVALLAAAAWILGGSLGLVRTMWVVAPLLVGLIGVWRMLRPLASRRAQSAGMIAFVALPLPWAAMASGSLAGLYALAVAPWLIDGLLHAEGMAPHASGSGHRHSLMRPAFGVGVALASAILFEPTVLVVLPVVVIGIAVGGLVSAAPGGIRRLVVSASIAVATAGILSLPFLLDLMSSAPTWAILADGRDGTAGQLRLQEILRFAVGPTDPGPLIWLLGLPMALPLLIGRSWRFRLAVKAASICLAGWILTLLAAAGMLPFGLPGAQVLLAAPAAAVILLLGLAVASVEHDLRTARFGWRQMLAPVAVAGAILSVLPSIGLLQTGRWGLGPNNFERSLPLASPGDGGSYRILWIGSPDFLPVSGRHLVADMAWAATIDGLPTLADRYLPVDDGSAALVPEVVLRAADGHTSRLGRDLAGLGIRYVVMIERLQPAPFSAADDAIAVPEALVEAFSSQLDLARIEGTNSSIRVFENTDWVSMRAALVPGFDRDIVSLSDLETRPLPGSTGVLAGAGRSIEGPVPKGVEVFIAQSPDDGWTLEVDGRMAPRRDALGWAEAFTVENGGVGKLSYSAPLWRRLALLLQTAMFLGLLGASFRRLLSGGT